MKTYKARGIVLHTIKYGDNSLIVYMLTDLHGRRTYMVRGSRTGRGGTYQPMFPLELVGLESPRMQMDRIKEVRPGQLLSSVPFDIRKNTIALFMAEVLYKMVREVEQESDLFDFVWDSLAQLDAMQEGIANFHLWFLVQMARYLGYQPGNDYTEGSCFDIGEGLFTHGNGNPTNVLDRESSRLLSYLLNTNALGSAGLKLSGRSRNDFLREVVRYLSYHLDTINNVRSLEILREVF